MISQPVKDSANPEPEPSFKILPIPLYRKHIQHSLKAQKEVVVRDYKYFSRLSAVGETTQATLKSISRCNTPRIIYKFQFDPYLCERSCLRDLSKAFKKIRCLRDLNIVFRRFDKVNESDIVLPCLVRHLRLIRLRFEFPKTNNINDDGIKNFARIFGKCGSIKYLEEVVTDLENISDAAFFYLPKYGQKMIHLEELKVNCHKLAKLDAKGPAFLPQKQNARCDKKLKKATLSAGIRTGWFSLNPEMNSLGILELSSMLVLTKLEYFSVRCCGAFAIDEFFSLFAANFPHMSFLTYYSMEFFSSRISDVDLVTLIQILSQAQQIKQFTLKVFQHPNISKGCICYLIKTLRKSTNLKKFDLYFRRLSLDREEIQELLGHLSEIKELGCTLFKNESLHISFNRAADST